MPRLKITDVSCKCAFVLGDHLIIGNQNNPVRISAQRDVMPGIPGRNAVAVAVILNKAGGAHPHGFFHVAIKAMPKRPQFSTLQGKDRINGLLFLFRMRA